MQVYSDKLANDKGKVLTTGEGYTTANWGSPATAKLDKSKPYIIANGNDLIVKDIGAQKKDHYYCLRDFNISNLNITISQDQFPTIDISGNSYDGVESRKIIIPDHIPEDQHARYIQGVFDGAK